MTDDEGGHTVLVTCVSPQGSTAEIGERLAARLRERGLRVRVAAVEDDPDPGLFDAVVLGSAVHNRDVVPLFRAYVMRRRATLQARPTWLFTVGLGPALTGPIGSWLGRQAPISMARMRDAATPVDCRAFAGVYERPANPLTRLVLRLLGSPFGDLRDWAAIDRWGADIADHINAVLAPAYFPESAEPS